MIEYNTGKPPTENGVYACRVEDDGTKLMRDIFLMWWKDCWWYLSSDQKFRPEVYGWLGPLRRTKHPDAVQKAPAPQPETDDDL